MKKIYYGRAVYNHKEINAVLKVLKNNSLSLTDGKNVKQLEKVVSKMFGKKYGLMVNSGSSANLLGLASFNFKKGSEIITPNLTFSTTVAPIYQLGLIPHFIGVEKNKFVADYNQIEKCINKKTVAIMIPNLLGNVANWKKIFQIAKKYKLKIIEDSADTIGYTINKKNTGKYSDIVIASTGPTKWLNVGEDKEKGGGIIAHNSPFYKESLYNENIAKKLNQMYLEIPNILESRINKASEFINAGIDLIGSDQPNAWLRALYFGSQKRIPYTPLHDQYPGFSCPVVDSYKNKLDWISIFP